MKGVYIAVTLAEPFWNSIRFTWSIQNGAKRPLTFGPSQPTWTRSLPISS